uniref:Uncharacterized protein n=1 Tax=Oryza meridionalis TaxID=40149 RepID=A0A0E0F3G0_9ORYZ
MAEIPAAHPTSTVDQYWRQSSRAGGEVGCDKSKATGSVDLNGGSGSVTAASTSQTRPPSRACTGDAQEAMAEIPAAHPTSTVDQIHSQHSRLADLEV